MELLIKKKPNEMVISFAGDKIAINLGDDALENNVNWNTNKINDFLIKIASSLGLEDKIEVNTETPEDAEDKVYEHIVSLFKAFANEYNN